MKGVNWYQVTVYTLTAIRFTWSVEKLQKMAAEGHETTVSGNALARAKNDLVISKK